MADDERVNGEFYLDSLVARLDDSRVCRSPALVVETFSSVGTPAEYEALRYWQSCFHKWVHHPYALAADPLVRACGPSRTRPRIPPISRPLLPRAERPKRRP